VKIEFLLKPPGASELHGGVVDPDDASFTAREPGRDVAGSAAELDDIPADNIAEDVQLRLRNAPDPPTRLGRRPCPPASIDVLRGPPTPDLPIAPEVVKPGTSGPTWGRQGLTNHSLR
jgi:hypothetical protein